MKVRGNVIAKTAEEVFRSTRPAICNRADSTGAGAQPLVDRLQRLLPAFDSGEDTFWIGRPVTFTTIPALMTGA
jgi:hypothetical protein